MVLTAISFAVLSACSDSQSPEESSVKEAKKISRDSTSMPSTPKPPVAKKLPQLIKNHGITRNDEYFWMRDDSRNSPEVLAHVQAENTYTRAKLSHTEDLQKSLYDEMTNRLEPNEESVPLLDKGYWHWYQYQENEDFPVHYRRKAHPLLNLNNVKTENTNADIPKPEIILDENELSQGHDFFEIAAIELSPNQTFLAYAQDTVSRRQYEVKIIDLNTGSYFPEVIKDTDGEIEWANDNQTFFYTKKHPQTLLPYQVYRHKVGTDPKNDELVYQEADDTFYVSLYKTRSEKFVAIQLSATMNSEVRLIDANKPTSEPKVFLPRESDHRYAVDHFNGQFVIQSDFNAPNEQLFVAREEEFESKEDWKVIVPHDDSRLLQEFELFDQFMVVSERINGTESLLIRNYQGEVIDKIEISEAAFTLGLDENPDPASKFIRYYYSSLTTPDSIFEYHLDSKTSELLKQDRVIGDFNPRDYRTERVFAAARDGKQIPVSLVYRTELFKGDGKNPLLQYGYGSYGYTIDPEFSISTLSLLDRGFVYAIAHIRGSKMLGRQWYEDGKKLKKKNTFTDFIDVTKMLIDKGYADPKRIYAYGGSAGGLLMGAVANQNPELYHGMVASVPFVDIVTTMLDESIPLTTGEYDEWGNPNEEEYFKYMLSYSPYDQVQAQDYPNLLVLTGLHDSQVQYFEPAKWVAKLRDKKTDDNLLLFDIDMTAGHGGKSGRYKSFLDIAKEYAFILDLAGINE